MKALLILLVFTLLGLQKCFRFRHNYRSASHARVMPSAPPPPWKILRFRGIHCEHLYIRTSCAFVPTLSVALVRLRAVKIYRVDYPKHIIIV